MAHLTTGRRVSVKRQARRALINAKTRAQAHADPNDQVITLLRGMATATAWLDGTHPLLADSTPRT